MTSYDFYFLVSFAALLFLVLIIVLLLALLVLLRVLSGSSVVLSLLLVPFVLLPNLPIVASPSRLCCPHSPKVGALSKAPFSVFILSTWGQLPLRTFYGWSKHKRELFVFRSY